MEQNNENNKTPFSPEEAFNGNNPSTPLYNTAATPPPFSPPPPPTDPMTPPAPAGGSQPPRKEGTGKTERTKKYWKRRLRRRRRHRRVRRFFFFLFTLLLGFVVAYGALFLAAYFAIGGLTLDTLQRFGIAKDADQYLTENGDVDLTDMTLLELLADLQAVRDDLSSYTLSTLIEHYGLVLPEDVQKIMPTDLYDVPLDQLFSDQAGTAVTENLTMGYILSFLPESMLSPRVIETISPRPLSLLTNGDFGALLADVQVGFLTGVTYDENGEVTYLDPAVPTLQEVTAKLDLGELLDAATNNGDLLKVIVENIGDAPAGPFVSGITEGPMVDDIVQDMKVSDLIVLNESTARYEFSLSNLTANAVLGNTMGYTLVDGVWYSTYTDNGDAADDVRVTGINAALADLSLAAIVNNQLSLTEVFGDLYVGDLQAGYERGDAIYGTAEGEGEPPLIGYEWKKDGAPLAETQQALANIALADLLEGELDLTAALGDILVGDAAGYTLVDGVWYSTYTDNGDPTDDVKVGGINAALADVSITSLINNEITISEIFADMYLGDLQEGYARGDAVYGPAEGEGEPPLIGYQWLKNGEPVSSVQQALADIPLADLLEGSLNLTDALGNILVGDAAGYMLVDGVWYSTYTDNGDAADDVKVGGLNAALADVSITSLINNEISISEIFADMYIGDLQEGYERGDAVYGPAEGEGEPVLIGYQWLKNGVPANSMQQALADVPLADLLEGKLNLTDALGDVFVGDAAGYTLIDGVWYSTYTDNGDDTDDIKVGGINAALADVSLASVIIDGIDLSVVLSDMYFGDLQAGYERGDAIYGTPEGEGEPPLIGYEWLKDGAAVSEMQKALANIALSDLLEGNLVLGDLLGDVLVGDASGYVRGEEIPNADPNAPKQYQFTMKDGTPVTGVMLTFANLSVSELLDGTADLEGSVKGMTIAEVMEFTKVNGVYYSTYVAENDPANVKVTGILAALADQKIKDLNQATVDGIMLGDVLGFAQENGAWLDENGSPVTGISAKLADCTIGTLSDPDELITILRDLTLAEALGYEKGADGIYYDKNGNAVTGILAELAETVLTDINSATIDNISLSHILGLTLENGVWVDENGDPATGISQKLAECTIGMLSDPDTFAAKLRELTLAEAMGYKKGNDGIYYDKNGNAITGILAELSETPLTNINSATIDNISLSHVLGLTLKNGVWVDENGDPVTGISAKLAECTIGMLSDSDVLAEKLRELTLAEAMGYEKGADGVYYDANGNAVTGILAELADMPLDSINSATIDNISLSTILGLTLENGAWVDENGQPATGISAKLADCTIGMLSDPATFDAKLRELTLAEAMGYKKGNNDIYYNANNQPITGILAELADNPLGSIDSTVIDNILIGKVMGYQQVAGVWYEADGSTPVEGLLLAFADLKIGELSNAQSVTSAIHKITLGNALGYTMKEDGHWYHVVDGEETLVRGLLAVLADSTVGDVDLDINTVPLGTILNYHKEDDGFWHDENGVKQTGIIALLSDETLDTLDGRLRALTIDDLMPNREGLLSTIDGTKPFSQLESECQKALHDATMGDLADIGVLSAANQQALDALGFPDWWRGLTVDQFLTALLSRIH